MKVLLPSIHVQAIASYLPERKEDYLPDLSGKYGENKVRAFVKATGISSHRLAAEGETSSDMAFKAARFLIEKEGIDVSTIDGLIFVSQTVDYLLPATSIILQDRLGLGRDTLCLDIHYGCSGYLYGLNQAAAWISSGMSGNVLLLTGETNSRLVHSKDASLTMEFGDAATATLVCRGMDEMCFHLQSDGSGYDKIIVPAGGARIPCSDETKKEREDEDGNVRTQENMYMDGMGVFSFILYNVPKCMKEMLAFQNWEAEEVGLYAMHQTNKFTIDCLRKKFKLAEELFPLNLDHTGNTGPNSIPLLLSEVGESYSSKQRRKTVLCAYGVGLSWGAIACDLSTTRFYKPINL